MTLTLTLSILAAKKSILPTTIERGFIKRRFNDLVPIDLAKAFDKVHPGLVQKLHQLKILLPITITLIKSPQITRTFNVKFGSLLWNPK